MEPHDYNFFKKQEGWFWWDMVFGST